MDPARAVWIRDTSFQSAVCVCVCGCVSEEVSSGCATSTQEGRDMTIQEQMLTL